jgi:hypothetical protein
MRDSKDHHKAYNKTLGIFEKNSKKIQVDNLGGLDSTASKNFKKELDEIKTSLSNFKTAKEKIILDQINKAPKVDSYLKKHNVPFYKLLDEGILKS